MRREAVEELRRQRQQHNRAAGVVATSMVDAIINTQQQTHQDPPADVNLSVDAGPGPNPSGNDALQFSVLCRTREQAEAALRVPWLEEVVLDFLEVQGLKEACQRVRDEGRRVVVATPRILKPDEQNLWQVSSRASQGFRTLIAKLCQEMSFLCVACIRYAVLLWWDLHQVSQASMV